MDIPIERVMRQLQMEARGNPELSRELKLAIARAEAELLGEQNQALTRMLAEKTAGNVEEIKKDAPEEGAPENEDKDDE